MSFPRVSRLGGVVLLAFFGSPLGAQSVPNDTVNAFRALSATAPAPDDAAIREKLKTLTYRLGLDDEARAPGGQAADATAAAPQAPALPPAAREQMRALRDQTVAQFEKQIAATDPVKDAAQRKSLEDALAQTRASYAAMLGETVGAAPPVSGAPADPDDSPDAKPRKLRIPATGGRQPSFDEAIANLRRVVRDNAPAEAIAGFEASEDFASANRCSAAASAALLMHRDVAAIAALLRASELQPDNPEHVVNLAGVAANIGMPRHALALLDRVGSSGKPFAVACGMNPRAVLLNNRATAYIQLKRFAEAEKLAREVVVLEPGMREGYVNLAHALYQQDDAGKKDEAVRFYRISRRPIPPQPPMPPGSSTVPPEDPIPPPTSSASAQGGIDEKADPQLQRRGRPSPYVIFDMSRGKNGSLPTIKIPRTMMDGKEMWPKVDKLQKELIHEWGVIGGKMKALEDLMRRRERSGEMPRISAERARDVFWYVSHTDLHPRLRSLQRDADKTSREAGIGTLGGQFTNPWGSKELQEKHDRIQATHYPSMKQYYDAMWEATEPYHSTWQAPIRQLESQVNRLAHEAYPYMTAIAANLSDPVHREYAMLLARHRMIGWSLQFIGPLWKVCRYDRDCMLAWGPHGPAGSAADPTPGTTPDADGCPDFLSGEFKVKASVEFVEVSLNCEKVGVEFSAGAWIKAFFEVEHNWSGESSIFIGGAVEAAPFEVGSSLGMKSGFYISFDANGNFSDCGLKSSTSSSFSLGVVGYEREMENSFSFVTAPGG